MEEVIVEIDINLDNKLVLLIRLKLLISTKEERNIFSRKEVNAIYFRLIFKTNNIYIYWNQAQLLLKRRKEACKYLVNK